MDNDKFQAKLLEVGQHILTSRKHRDVDWDATALVVNIGPGELSSTGYIYNGDTWKPASVGGEQFFMLCEKLQEITKSPAGEKWKQALIHVTQPGPEINVKFEYDDATRWSLKKVSLDLKDYAMSLHPNAA